MNTIIVLSLLPFALVCANAKEFLNLNFDEGAYPSGPAPDFLQSVEYVLPGWVARMGDHVLTEIVWNNAYPENGLVGVRSAGGLWGPLPEGRYAVRLTAGPEYPSLDPIVSASISQIGSIPSDARSLIFRANLGHGVPTEIRFDGQLLTPFLLGDPQNQPTWGGEWAVDVANYAGREGQLSFTTFAVPGQSFGGMDIDSLRFSSSVVVPEPTAWALLGTGGLAIFLASRRRSIIE